MDQFPKILLHGYTGWRKIKPSIICGGKKSFAISVRNNAYLLQSEYSLSSTVTNLFIENEIQDSQLRMIFACCHPSIPEDSQEALVLKTLCGLSISEIARAFLTSDETISKRIYRAKEKIKAEKIELEVPEDNELPERVDAVLKSLYLLFNEGYNLHTEPIDTRDLCEEAIRFDELLRQHPVNTFPRTCALLALMHFQAFPSRCEIG
jgi:RNA polymerase sigma-70 factor (ECF subfamily)